MATVRVDQVLYKSIIQKCYTKVLNKSIIQNYYTKVGGGQWPQLGLAKYYTKDIISCNIQCNCCTGMDGQQHAVGRGRIRRSERHPGPSLQPLEARYPHVQQVLSSFKLVTKVTI